MAMIACIGAGNVGRAWAVVFACAGHEVRIQDASAEEIETRALPLARATIAQLAEAGLCDEAVDKVAARIKVAPDIASAVSEVDWVQESVREDVEVKRAVFQQISRDAPEGAILASSTSAIPGSRFMEGIAEPQRALVAHPVNPPSHIPLVELCATPWTSVETMAHARQFMESVGMKPITIHREIEGFVLNRLQYTLVAEAMHLVGEGYCSAEDIDAVLVHGLALRWASIGPFEVAHLNSTQGFLGFVDQLGEMMKTMGRSARTDYDWDRSLAEKIHARLAERTPIDTISERQAWRNARILATRRMQQG